MLPRFLITFVTAISDYMDPSKSDREAVHKRFAPALTQPFALPHGGDNRGTRTSKGDVHKRFHGVVTQTPTDGGDNRGTRTSRGAVHKQYKGVSASLLKHPHVTATTEAPTNRA